MHYYKTFKHIFSDPVWKSSQIKLGTLFMNRESMKRINLRYCPVELQRGMVFIVEAEIANKLTN